jgi:hypothetical protein
MEQLRPLPKCHELSLGNPHIARRDPGDICSRHIHAVIVTRGADNPKHRSKALTASNNIRPTATGIAQCGVNTTFGHP